MESATVKLCFDKNDCQVEVEVIIDLYCKHLKDQLLKQIKYKPIQAVLTTVYTANKGELIAYESGQNKS